MKITYAYIASAIALVSVTQAAVVTPSNDNALERRSGDANSGQSWTSGLQSIWGSLGHSGSNPANSAGTTGARVASVSNSSSSAASSSTAGADTSSSSDSPLADKPKLGLAWANRGSMPIRNFMTDKVSWFYSWDASPGWKNAPSNITFCPMLWGERNVDDFRQKVLDNLDGKYNQGKCVLAMNEPNQHGQSDMSVGQACSLMRQNIMPLKRLGWYVVSPATTSAPSGETWMDSFRTTCPDVWNGIDAVALHYYDTSVSAFKNYVNHWHNKYDKPIWVTEYACQNFNGGAQCSLPQTYNFHTQMSEWFDSQDFVEAYAPFGVMQNMQGVSDTNRMAYSTRPSPLFYAVAQ